MFFREVYEATFTNIEIANLVPKAQRSQEVSCCPAEITYQAGSTRHIDLLELVGVEAGLLGAGGFSTICTQHY